MNLDGVALINLIMCIGFSVDFSAHISYHYHTEADKTPDERIRGSLYALGIPIMQGAGSTILGVLGLFFAPSYLFVTFFKMIFLVISLGIIHGLVLLPVLLSFFGPGSCGGSQGKGSGANGSTKSTRSSGLSTPTTISCHFTQQNGGVGRFHPPPPAHLMHHVQQPNHHQMCYTVNMGFRNDADAPGVMAIKHLGQDADAVDGGGAKPQAGRHCHNHKHHRRGRRSNPDGSTTAGSTASTAASKSNNHNHQQKLSYISHLPTGYVREYATSTPRNVKPRFEEKNGRENAGERSGGSNNSNSNNKSNNSKHRTKDNSDDSRKALEGRGEGVHKRALSKSKSHRPQSYYVAPDFLGGSGGGGDQTAADSDHYHNHQLSSPATEPQLIAVRPVPGADPADGGHPMLRKYHSFPYHMFTNEAGYSSSDDGANRSPGHRHHPHHQQHHHHHLQQQLQPAAGAKVTGANGLVLRPPRLPRMNLGDTTSDDSSGSPSASPARSNNQKKR